MYKLILVDDEAVVRRGIRNTIRWEEHGFELIGDYADGREALEAIERDKPDLVISDICMPFMDGLELAGYLAASYPCMKVIILTGYDDFNYAQQALRLKVYDFLLKPIMGREIRALLDKVRQDMDEERRSREDLSRLQSQLNQSLPLLRERFLEQLVVSGLPGKKLEERLRYFSLPDLPAPCLVMVLDIDDYGDRKDALAVYDTELLRFAGFNIIEEIVLRESGLAFRTHEERIVAIVPERPEQDAPYALAYRVAEEARHHIEAYLKYTVSIGIGRVCLTTDELPLSYKSALSALDYRLLLGKNRVISITDMEGTQSPERPACEWDRKLAALVKTGTPDEIRQSITHIVAELRSSGLPIEACYLHMQKLVIALLNAVEELGVPEWPYATGQPALLTDIYRFKTLDDMEAWLKEAASSALSVIAENRDSMTGSLIARAVQYLQEHYANEKMTLQEICRHVLVSTSYFSLIFKQQTGVTFVEYLTNVRMEKAKELLRHTSLKFYEIASKVGYADPNYFSVLFKKHTGRTPTEYRDNWSRETHA